MSDKTKKPLSAAQNDYVEFASKESTYKITTSLTSKTDISEGTMLQSSIEVLFSPNDEKAEQTTISYILDMAGAGKVLLQQLSQDDYGAFKAENGITDDYFKIASRVFENIHAACVKRVSLDILKSVSDGRQSKT